MEVAMEEQLIQVLQNTQLAAEGPRKQAEVDLGHAEHNPAFPFSLTNIASHASIPTETRQAALSALRAFIQRNWGADDEDGPVIPISDAVREQIRPALLELALSSDDRRIKTLASYAVGKIANVDFPDHWPALLPTLLRVIPTGNDGQLHGALKVLSDLVDECLSDGQFFSMAQDIVNVVYEIAVNEGKRPFHRALAVSVFRVMFDLMDQVKDDHPNEVRGFAEQALAGWFPFFLQVINLHLPSSEHVAAAAQPGEWNGLVALKLQAIKCLIKVRQVFPALLLPETPRFFTAVWAELPLLESAYGQMYIENQAQGRLEDSDNLPYTLDFLVMEEVDFLNTCLRASLVQKELEGRLATHGAAHLTPWILELTKLTTSYGRITAEEEGLWDIDVSLYLAEEASVSANYTPRTACGDLMIRLGEWLNQQALEGLFAFSKPLFATAEGASWRYREAALYLLNMLVNDFLDCGKTISAEVATAFLELVGIAVSQPNQPLLRARGYLIAGVLVQFSPEALGFFERILASVTSDESELVQMAAIKSIDGFIQSGSVAAEYQVRIISAMSQWVAAKDMSELEESDDLLVSLAETLRSAIKLNMQIVLSQEVPALDLLFLFARHGASNFQVGVLITETFEEIVMTMSDTVVYRGLCEKVLPSLMAALNVPDATEDDPLVTMALELMASLAQYGSEPLPPGFVLATLPKLTRFLMEAKEGAILRPAAETVKYLLQHDHQQMFMYQDGNGRSGLEICLHVIDRLLGNSVEDNAATEVGGLAAELVEKAGPERLGPFLPQLLQAVAMRLETADAAAFVQSLILVFARLSLVTARDVVEFLSGIQINGQSGLQVVLSKWLENSVNFAGYDEIRQNVIALSKLFELNDARVSQIRVRGELIVTQSNRIMTRSRSKQSMSAPLCRSYRVMSDKASAPDQYTIIPAPLKIIKILTEELVSASGMKNSAHAAAAVAAECGNGEDDHDGWEDDEIHDLGMSAKHDFAQYLEENQTRNRDDQTQAFLTNFFRETADKNVADFNSVWYGLLTEEERIKLNELASA